MRPLSLTHNKLKNIFMFVRWTWFKILKQGYLDKLEVFVWAVIGNNTKFEGKSNNIICDKL